MTELVRIFITFDFKGKDVVSTYTFVARDLEDLKEEVERAKREYDAKDIAIRFE